MRVKAILDQNALADDQALPAETAVLVAKRRHTLGAASMLFYQQPLEPVRGLGVWLYEADGRAYLDAYNNVPVLGHAHPQVVEAVSRQLATLNTHSRYLDRSTLDYADRLLATLDLPEARVMFTCSGSEANDLALRLAQQATGEQGVIVSRAAYHGNTALSMAVSPSAWREGDCPDWLVAVDLPGESEDPSTAMAEAVTEAIELLRARGYGVAALLTDTIFSSDGVFVGSANWLDASVNRVREAGGIWIADEVQPGFGRLGEVFWGYQRNSARPDLVTLGKPMGNGYPIAAVVAGDQHFARLAERCGYFNTFGGSSAAIAAASATLSVIQDESLQANALNCGSYLSGVLSAVAESSVRIGQIRQAGLYCGVDMLGPDGEACAETATAVVNLMRQEGVLIGAAGALGNTLKIRPPLCFAPDHADRLADALHTALSHLQS